MGLGLCAAKKMHDSSHYNGIRRASFTGLTGHVRYNTLMNERGQESLAMAMRHLSYSKGNQTDQFIDVSRYDNEAWIDTGYSYIYVLPDRVRNVYTTNHTMSLPTQYFFMMTGLIIVVVSVHLLLYINRNKHLTDFAVAQPMYLSLHCAGSIVLSLSHFLSVAVRGGYQYGSLICSLLNLVRVIGILLICYTCFIKVLIILQEIKHSRQYMFKQIFFSKLIAIPTIICILLIYSIFQGYGNVLQDIITREDEYGFVRESYRSCTLRKDKVPTYTFCVLAFVMLTLVYSVNLLHTVSLQSTNDASSLSQTEQLSVDEVDRNNDDERKIHISRCLNESKLILHFILADICVLAIYAIWNFSTKHLVSYRDLSNCVLQTFYSSSNLVMIVVPYYLSGRAEVISCA
mmetsp:Transcript_15608/g.20360  ORF Transcript_15608/g.20360 Transcript_15608/m.20360 type:complete len:402 (-) Transcript_15608:1617-2822(-)